MKGNEEGKEHLGRVVVAGADAKLCPSGARRHRHEAPRLVPRLEAQHACKRTIALHIGSHLWLHQGLLRSASFSSQHSPLPSTTAPICPLTQVHRAVWAHGGPAAATAARIGLSVQRFHHGDGQAEERAAPLGGGVKGEQFCRHVR